MKNKMFLPALRGVLGKWVYYSSLMTASQISEWVKPAKDIRESKILDEILQRELKERKGDIAKYLLSDSFRFFNSIIVGVFGGTPEWVEFDVSKFKSHIREPNVDLSMDSMGILIFDGDEQMFAIDGQHRVAGIQIAREKDQTSPLESQQLKDDQFSVIFIAHIDDELGKKRTRKLFSDINKNAKQVVAGDKIKIDEEDSCAIVARRIYAQYSFFRGGELIAVTENSNLAPKDVKHFTNLMGLYTAIKIIKKEILPIPKNTKEYSEEYVQPFLKIIIDFFDFIFTFQPDFKSSFRKEGPIDLTEMRIGNKINLAFRPVGLFLLARLYSYFYKIDDLKFFERNLNLVNFEMPSSPFKNILWTNGKIETKNEKQILAFHIALYILGRYMGSIEDLEKRYRNVVKNDNAELPKKLIVHN